MTAAHNDNRRFLTAIVSVIAIVALLAWLTPIVADQRLARLVQSGITGLLVGGIYALIALGIVIINKASGVFNFAHGWMMLAGGLLFYSFFSVTTILPVAAAALALPTVALALTMGGWRALREGRTLLIGGAASLVIILVLLAPVPFLRGVVGAACGSVLLGLAAERFAIRPLIGQPLFAMVLMTLALSEVIHGILQTIWGSIELPLPVFAGIASLGIPTPIRFPVADSQVIVRTELLIAFVLAIIAFLAFVAFFQFTSVGLSMRATAENQKLAQSVGLRVRVILGVAWAIAALLATVAGVLQGGATTLSLNLPLLALRAFPAVLLGGLESVPGALVGGLIIGLVQEYANLLFPGTQAGTELAPYLVLMVVLVIRPDGLFGQKRIERI